MCSSHLNSCFPTGYLVVVLVVLKGIRIWCIVMLKVPAPDRPATILLLVADNNRKLAIVRLGPSLESLSILLRNLTSIPGFLVVDTLKV
jgi:hypothetical protein